MKKKILVLATVLMILVTNVAVTKAEETNEITVLCQNVDGLPFQYLWGDDIRAISLSQSKLGKLLNESGYDVVCVQEDFQFHDLLAAQMTNYPYKTTTSGGVPVGSGLNVFSKYPIYNVERITWKETYGVLSNGSDELTPKGFMKVTIDKDGVLIDIYNLHCEASDSGKNKPIDAGIRKAQYQQLVEFINKDASNNPIIIVGDINDKFHNGISNLYEIVVEENNFVDAWVHVHNNDDYFQGENKQTLIDYYESIYEESSANWDSIEREFCRSSASVTIEVTDFGYKFYTDDQRDKKSLTDHCACFGRFKLTVKGKQSGSLNNEVVLTVKEQIVKTVQCITKTVSLIIKDIPRYVKSLKLFKR